METKIITFSCRDSVHVYPPKCGLIPRTPYRVHNNIYDAVKYLESRGVIEPKVIIEGKR